MLRYEIPCIKNSSPLVPDILIASQLRLFLLFCDANLSKCVIWMRLKILNLCSKWRDDGHKTGTIRLILLELAPWIHCIWAAMMILLNLSFGKSDSLHLFYNCDYICWTLDVIWTHVHVFWVNLTLRVCHECASLTR